MQPVIERRWRLRPADPDKVAALVRDGSFSEVVARLLVARGMGEVSVARSFLSPAMDGIHDPFLLLGMETAVERLVAGVQRKERICIYGDYDVDGITAVALLVDFFRAVGADVFYHIPRRIEDGYGLSANGLKEVADRGAKVVVTVDCGITAVAEASLCSTLGLDLIITDHHLPGGELPKALAVINPLQAGCRFPFKAVAGVGLAFNLALALRSRLRARGFFAGNPEPNLRRALDLVALGTIADVVPLVDENRVFVTHGLQELTAGHRVGIRALKTVAGIDGEVTCGAVGFQLAPRLNAAGRLEEAAPGVELLLTHDRHHAEALADELDAGNRERQDIEQHILHQALDMIRTDAALAGRKTLVLASEEWHPGVIGIVASRLVERFHRPTVLIAMKDGEGRGSGRSIPPFHLHDALHACSDHLLKFGGHRVAAGLAIGDTAYEAFVEAFEETAATLTADDLLPELLIDHELKASELSLEVADVLRSLAPFGMGNAEPLFVLRNASVVDQRILKGKHLKLKLQAGQLSLEAIGFAMAERQVPARMDVAFNLQVNVWQGRKSVQLRVRDFRTAR